MKKQIKFLVLLALVAFAATSCSESKLKDGTYNFEVYATNDLHGRFFDSLYVSNNGYKTHQHSLASVSTVINEARNNIGNEHLVLLDIGDHLQGDNAVYYSNFVDTVSEHIFSQVMNYLEFDATVVGNHDIEPGPAVYDKVEKELNMPYLAANAIDTKTGEPYFEPYTILNKGGVKIAVIGMTNPNIPNWLAPHLWDGIKFEEIVPSLEHWIEYVREKEQPHFLIVAMHAGLGDEASDSMENPARYVAKNVKGIDLLLAAHDHRIAAEKIDNGEKEIWLLEGGSRAAALSKASVALTVKDGAVVATNVDGESISMEGVTPDAEYMAHFRDDFLKVKEFTNREVGTLSNTISSRDAYFGPSAYIDMIHTVQLNASGADISFAAPLSFNATINKGVLNYQNLLDIYPFENQLNVIELTGQEVKDYLEYSYSNWLNEEPVRNGHLLNISKDEKRDRWSFNHPSFNFDSAAGIKYEVDITKNKGNRVNIISMADGSNFKADATYTVALTSYRASGGGYLLENGAGIPKEEIQGRIIALHADIREILYDQIQSNGTLEAKKLNQWRFVPNNVADILAERDSKVLFK
ncbi:MAG: bifunctional metallophosphatase/5'-nucleotidase [Bacteroidales bacterium]|nr:bifunctional metallophosphatase/5'-nucleotidase [Bacteroidales bacterium]